MTDTELRKHIAAERRELAGILASLEPSQWDAPSLCAGWRIREVVAHMTYQYRHPGPRILLEILKARGNMNRALDRAAKRDAAAATPIELADCLRDNAEHAWKPPGGGYTGALSHDVIHGLDITVALGIDRRVPLERLLPVLNGTDSRGLKFFGVDLDGVKLRADDVDWSQGTGEVLTGAGQDLLLVVTGRRLPPGTLSGPAAERFTATA